MNLWEPNAPVTDELVMRRIAWFINDCCERRGTVTKLAQNGIKPSTLAKYRNYEFGEVDEANGARGGPQGTEKLMAIIRLLGYRASVVFFAAEASYSGKSMLQFVDYKLTAQHPQLHVVGAETPPNDFVAPMIRAVG